MNIEAVSILNRLADFSMEFIYRVHNNLIKMDTIATIIMVLEAISLLIFGIIVLVLALQGKLK